MSEMEVGVHFKQRKQCEQVRKLESVGHFREHKNYHIIEEKRVYETN